MANTHLAREDGPAGSGTAGAALSFPAERPGEGRIRAYPGGVRRSGKPVIVGSWELEGRRCRYTLWSRPGRAAPDDESGEARTLKLLRGQLEERLAEQGEWWITTSPESGDFKLTTRSTGKGTVDIVVDAGGRSVTVGTAKAISA